MVFLLLSKENCSEPLSSSKSPQTSSQKANPWVRSELLLSIMKNAIIRVTNSTNNMQQKLQYGRCWLNKDEQAQLAKPEEQAETGICSPWSASASSPGPRRSLIYSHLNHLHHGRVKCLCCGFA